MPHHPYESQRYRDEYLSFHYRTPRELLPWAGGPRDALDFCVRTARLCREFHPRGGRALDLGCAVGRSTFELARFCREVVGVDFSRNFIAVANRLQRHGRLAHEIRVEGDITRPAIARVPSGVRRERVTFERGDACRLRRELGEFDIVLMANLLDRLPDPRACLEQAPSLVRKDGILVLTTPCTWMEEFTPREKWLGGFRRAGRAVRTLDTLRGILAPSFRLEARRDMPFLIREHERKFQWNVAEATVWRKTTRVQRPRSKVQGPRSKGAESKA